MIPYENCDTSLANIKQQLAEYGVAVVPNVLNEQEVAAMQNGMWQMLEYVSEDFEMPIQRNNEKSWRSFFELFPKHSMLIQNFGLAHDQYIWDLRQNEKVVDVFAEIWDCDKRDLVTSFDGFSVHFPPEVTNRGWYKGHKWLHVDQSYTRNDFECIQGYVTAWDIEEGDASFVYLEKSHHKHQAFREKFGIEDQSDWFRLNDEQMDYYINNGHPRKAIQCKAGSMVLWDSRLVHSGIEPQKGRKNPKLRHVVYICQMPRKLCTPKMLEKRIHAFETKRTTNHWPSKVKLFPKKPRTYGKELPTVKEPDAPILTDLGKRLVGYTEKEATLF